MNQLRHNEEAEIREGKVYALLAYLSILCIIPLALKKENPFVLAHGKQGLVLFVGQVALFIIHIVVGVWILRVGMFVLGILSFFGIIYVLKGEYYRLPIVAEIADKISL